MAQDVHEQMIREREQKRDRLQAQVDSLNIEIRILQEAQARTQGEKPIRRTRLLSGERERPLLEKWANVLRFIGQNGDTSYHTLYEKANDLGVSKDSMRGQMANYVNRGWLNRVSDGVFKLTDSGAAKCGFQKESGPEGPDNGEDVDSIFG